MNQDKLKQIIADKNERLEDDALRTAACLIEMIAKEQKEISARTENILKLRRELAELEVTQLDSTAILG